VDARVRNRRRPGYVICAAAVFASCWTVGFAQAVTVRQGIVAFQHEDYVEAARILAPLAAQGDPAAQDYLGFMYETGRGVPRNYTQAAVWYRRAADQGDTAGQFALGLLYDKGQGVPQDYVEAHKWLNLAAAGAPRNEREFRVRMRDALVTKMTRGEIAISRQRALDWRPHPEPPGAARSEPALPYR
jgi:uncharacterized protein